MMITLWLFSSLATRQKKSLETDSFMKLCGEHINAYLSHPINFLMSYPAMMPTATHTAVGVA